MAKRKKGGTRLPRVTVLALNRRELAAFVSAVEKMGTLAEDMRLLLAAIRSDMPKKKKPKPADDVPPFVPADPEM